jgi:hypothetical protein
MVTQGRHEVFQGSHRVFRFAAQGDGNRMVNG